MMMCCYHMKCRVTFQAVTVNLLMSKEVSNNVTAQFCCSA